MSNLYSVRLFTTSIRSDADRKQRIRIQRTTLESLGLKQQQKREDRWRELQRLKLSNRHRWSRRKKIPVQRRRERKITVRPLVDQKARVQRIERQGKRPSKLSDRYVSHFHCMPHTRTDADKQARRAEKKASTTTFSTERKKQLDSHKKLVSNGRAADMAAGARGVISLS